MSNSGTGVADHAIGRRWIAACIKGELIGFVPPAVTGAALVSLSSSDTLLVTGLVVAGIGEGLILGLAQRRVLADVFTNLTGWARATGAAAGIAWLAGMGGSTAVGRFGPSSLVWVVPGWIVGLLSMGVLQAWRLRDADLRHTTIWIRSTTIAWLIGVTIPVIALSVIPNGWPLAVHVVVAVAAAVAMGATVGAITGRTLQNIRDANLKASCNVTTNTAAEG